MNLQKNYSNNKNIERLNSELQYISDENLKRKIIKILKENELLLDEIEKDLERMPLYETEIIGRLLDCTKCYINERRELVKKKLHGKAILCYKIANNA